MASKRKPKAITQYRSAVSGEWVTRKYAEHHNKTTDRVTIKKK